MLKFKFKFEQRRKVGLIRVETAPINRWDYYKNLGTGIIAFGLIFNPVEFLEKLQKNKRKKASVQLGQNSRSAQAQKRFGPGEPSGAHTPGLNLTGGAQAPVREREARERRG